MLIEPIVLTGPVKHLLFQCRRELIGLTTDRIELVDQSAQLFWCEICHRRRSR